MLGLDGRCPARRRRTTLSWRLSGRSPAAQRHRRGQDGVPPARLPCTIGWIPEAQARVYGADGAAALSVVVEPDFFHGGLGSLVACRRGLRALPAIAEGLHRRSRPARSGRGTRAPTPSSSSPPCYEAAEMARYARLARGLGLVPLVETHDADDIAKLGGEPWEIVGINNRDLRTFEVDLPIRSRAGAVSPVGSGEASSGERHPRWARRAPPARERLRRFPHRGDAAPADCRSGPRSAALGRRPRWGSSQGLRASPPPPDALLAVELGADYLGVKLLSGRARGI